MKCYICGKKIEDTRNMKLDSERQIVFCSECSNPNIYSSGSTTIKSDNDSTLYVKFNCNDCGRSFNSLEYNPRCMYCDSNNCIRME